MHALPLLAIHYRNHLERRVVSTTDLVGVSDGPGEPPE